MSSTARTPFPLLSDNDVASYSSAVRALTRHTAEQERELIRRYHQEGSLSARDEVLRANMWLSSWCARRFSFSGLSEADLIQEASIGMLKAIEKFDLSVTTRFSTYAVKWAKNEVNNFVINNWRAVKVATTKPRRKVFHNLYKLVEGGEVLTKSRIASIAEQLEVPVSDVQAVAVHMRNDIPMCGYSDEGEEVQGFEESFGSEDLNPELEVLQASEIKHNSRMLSGAFSVLNDRERDIINSRVVNDDVLTLDVLSDRYGVSKERIRQLQQISLNKMGKWIMAA